MVDFHYQDAYTVSDLMEIVRLLRRPGGCPWDREQTHESIRRNFLEEAYEVAEAIDEKSPDHLKEELGDVLLQVLFHTCIEEEQGRFTLDDVATAVSRKLIYRHPHVFGTQEVSGAGQVLENWEELKRKEKGQATHTAALDSVARSLPGLWRAEKLQNKAKKAGFDWPDVTGAMDKLTEELSELREAIRTGGNVEEELGDLLFAAVNVSRFVSCDAEVALGRACDKFLRRFAQVEAGAQAKGASMEKMTLEALDALWDEAKARERAQRLGRQEKDVET